MIASNLSNIFAEKNGFPLEKYKRFLKEKFFLSYWEVRDHTDYIRVYKKVFLINDLKNEIIQKGVDFNKFRKFIRHNTTISINQTYRNLDRYINKYRAMA
jgi:hypothetical protein